MRLRGLRLPARPTCSNAPASCNGQTVGGLPDRDRKIGSSLKRPPVALQVPTDGCGKGGLRSASDSALCIVAHVGRRSHSRTCCDDRSQGNRGPQQRRSQTEPVALPSFRGHVPKHSRWRSDSASPNTVRNGVNRDPALDDRLLHFDRVVARRRIRTVAFRSDRLGTDQQRHLQPLPVAVDVVEADLAQPLKLRLDIERAI